MPAQECLGMGVANKVVAPEALRQSALDWAETLSAKAPLASALTKRIARSSAVMGFSETLTLEAELQTFCASTEDSQEAVRAFTEKRQPEFKGR